MSTIQNIATAADRPSGLGTSNKGATYFQLDSGRLIIWDGTNWNEYFYDLQADPAFAANQLAYPGANSLYTSSSYTISTAPAVHYDANFISGTAGTTLNAGEPVTSWFNRSGSATDYDAVQAETSKQPLLDVDATTGYKSVYFDGGDYLSSPTAYSLSGDFTFIAVGNSQADNSNMVFFGQGLTGSTYHWLEYYGTTYGLVGSVTDTTYGPNYTSIQQFWSTRNDTTFNMYVQGGNSILSANTTMSRSLSHIGAGGIARLAGDIYEIMVFSSDLSVADKNTVRNYLNNKYSTLPTSSAFA